VSYQYFFEDVYETMLRMHSFDALRGDGTRILIQIGQVYDGGWPRMYVITVPAGLSWNGNNRVQVLSHINGIIMRTDSFV